MAVIGKVRWRGSWVRTARLTCRVRTGTTSFPAPFWGRARPAGVLYGLNGMIYLQDR